MSVDIEERPVDWRVGADDSEEGVSQGGGGLISPRPSQTTAIKDQPQRPGGDLNQYHLTYKFKPLSSTINVFKGDKCCNVCSAHLF